MGSSRDNSRPTRRLLGMAVPNFQSLMRTVLVALEDGQIRPGKEIQEVVRTALGLTGDDLAHVLDQGLALGQIDQGVHAPPVDAGAACLDALDGLDAGGRLVVRLAKGCFRHVREFW